MKARQHRTRIRKYEETLRSMPDPLSKDDLERLKREHPGLELMLFSNGDIRFAPRIFKEDERPEDRHAPGEACSVAAQEPQAQGDPQDKDPQDSQRAMETHLYTEEERGRRAQKEPSADKKAEGGGVGRATALPTGEPPKWKRLGFESNDDMKCAEFLANHPEEVREVIAEAKENEEVEQVPGRSFEGEYLALEKRARKGMTSAEAVAWQKKMNDLIRRREKEAGRKVREKLGIENQGARLDTPTFVDWDLFKT